MKKQRIQEGIASLLLGIGFLATGLWGRTTVAASELAFDLLVSKVCLGAILLGLGLILLSLVLFLLASGSLSLKK